MNKGFGRTDVANAKRKLISLIRFKALFSLNKGKMLEGLRFLKDQMIANGHLKRNLVLLIYNLYH
ncbi:hypothetical protein [uncultured Draconibacterium sp.]|uniref:hypothetical protein n=1 Tax=uncultured Draconibacterium sp. TaxID=1573823 RepID=UPI003217F7BB